jgi:hypothetical protein
MWATLYTLHYIQSTHNHGIIFSSKATAPLHSYIHFPDSANVEDYSDAKHPPSDHCAPLTSYSDVCWGSQIDSAVCDGTLLPLFKLWSMIGGAIFH